MRAGFAINTTSGGGSSCPWGSAVTFGHSAKPDFVLVGRLGDGSNYAEMLTWDGSDWDDGSGTDVFDTDMDWDTSNRTYVEGRISKSDLSSPSTLDVQFYVSGNNETQHGTFDAVPDDEVSTGWNDPTTLDNYQSSINAVSISGNSGFRMMSSPVAGTIYSDLLNELWIQGMTNGDITGGTANVWTLSGQSWSALSNLNTASLTAGQGFLVYVYADIDWDGDSDLPVNLHITGAYNNASATVPSSGSIADDDFALAGNPYASTIDFDNITLNNVAVTTSVWDDANSDWKTWNKTSQSGDLTGGLIAPYQGFWIEGDGGSGTITIETADKSSSSGTFYRTLDGDNMGRMVFNVSSDGHSSSNYFSFHEGGTLGVDDGESELLLPFQASSRVVMMSVVEGDAHKISSYPYDQEGSLSIPFDVMRLSLDETNYVTVAEEVTLTWDLEELPDHISMTLTDNITGTETYLDYESEYVFTTEPKGSFSANYDGPIGTYPVVGEPRFTLSVTYGALGQNDDATLPSDFALHPIYPNPFNPSATISFDIPDVSSVALNVYDVKGALVETLLQDHMKPGKHHYNWEPQGLSSGVYFMKLTTAKQTFTQKVTYIK
ncbi:MAG: T9SS type A sorting domain-containing protein [Candidatus Marinimicrobia bacterium]|nr:T9SS type A sorting domain-containing protein [Candidatus Neomarinimicrobiota bacterium]